MGTSVLHIKTEVECRVYLFEEEKGIAKPGTYFNLEVRKGEQDLLFVSTEDEMVICRLLFNVEDIDTDYRMIIEESRFITLTDEATEEELASGVSDEYGVVYSQDGLQLLKCQNEKLKTYRVKDGCKIIRSNAFYIQSEWPLANMNLCSLSSISFPKGLTYIGDGAFYGCLQLNNIFFPEELLYIGDGAFAYCCNLYQITLPPKLTRIGNYAFSNCNFFSIILPESLKYIGEGTFFGCDKLANIILPKDLMHIGDMSFSNCKNLSSINIPPNIKYIGNRAFYYCLKLSKAIIPERIAHIGGGAFNCTNIKTIEINTPDYTFKNGCLVRVEGNSIISFLSNEKNVIMPDCITHIEDRAFEGSSLASIRLPNSLTHIGNHVFEGCSSLASITFPNTLTHIGNHAFDGCRSLTNMILPNSLIHIGEAAFKSCENLSSLLLPIKLISIGDYAFQYCNNLTAISLSRNLTKIGFWILCGCSKLKKIYIPIGMRSHFEQLLDDDLHDRLVEDKEG